MTTNVKISTAAIEPGKVLKVHTVDRETGAILSSHEIREYNLEAFGTVRRDGVKRVTFPDLNVGSGTKLVIEEEAE